MSNSTETGSNPGSRRRDPGGYPALSTEKWLKRAELDKIIGGYPAWNCNECAREECNERRFRIVTKRSVCWIFKPTDEAVLFREVLLECRGPAKHLRSFFE